MLYKKENPHGGDVYTRPVELDYSANINPLGTPEAVRRAIIDAAGSVHRYPDPYCRVLIRAIAEFEGADTEHILCGSGAAELIFSYCSAIKPRRAIVPAPTFSEYETALRAVGCGIEYLKLPGSEDFDFTEECVGAIRDMDADVLMLCSPNNPTGRLIHPEKLERIRRICGEKGMRLFLDECFLDLTDNGSENSMKCRLAEDKNIFILKAFTKSFGMAGVRLGYCLCSDEKLLEAMSATVQPWNISVLAQSAGVAALSQRRFLEEGRDIIASQRRCLTEGLRALGLHVIDSAANYILFFAEAELKEKLLEEGILIRSCANYVGLGEGWFRIAVKMPGENKILLEALRRALHG